jgi:hypothetical protein
MPSPTDDPYAKPDGWDPTADYTFLVAKLGDPFSRYTSPDSEPVDPPVTPAAPPDLPTLEQPAVSGWPQVTDGPPRPES